ncbi:MAG TPA: hypothetical protein VGE66_20890 [Chitinophagaceae bacterium]
MIYSKYLVKEADHFDPFYFPALMDDLDVIITSMAKSPGTRSSVMLVSFVKDNSLEAEWVQANPVLAELITSRSMPVSNLEALFASSQNNPVFRRQLEDYILDRFRSATGVTVY